MSMKTHSKILKRKYNMSRNFIAVMKLSSRYKEFTSDDSKTITHISHIIVNTPGVDVAITIVTFPSPCFAIVKVLWL